MSSKVLTRDEPPATHATTVTRAADWLRRYGDLLIARDATGIAALFAEEGVVVPGPFEAPIVGRAAIEQFYTAVFGDAEVHDILWSAPLCRGAEASAEWWATLSEGGRRASEPGSLHFAVDEHGLCRSWRAYPFVGESVVDRPTGWPDAIGLGGAI